MSFSHWLSNRLGLSPRPASRRKTPATRRTFRPTLEALEARWVPSTLTVSSIADTGAGSLRADIAAAQNGDTINFALSPGSTITLKSELLINKNLTITGPGASQLTVSGNNSSRVFEVASGTQVSLSGLTISNGFAVNGAGILVDTGAVLAVSNSALSGNAASKSQKYVGNFGGGIDNYGTATVSSCTLTNNTSLAGGGGIYNHATLTVNNNSVVSGSTDAGIANTGNATISGSTLSNNSGSAIYNFTSGTVTVRDSLLSGNSATEGGGIFNTGAATISNCTLSGNSASEYGGGIYSSGNSSISGSGTLNVSGCTLSGNSSIHGSGGGIDIVAGTVSISNCILSGNSAPGGGGGIYASGGTVTLTNDQIYSNTATGFGGGLFVEPGATFHLDAFTVANIINNRDSSGLNGPTANIDGSYTMI